MYDTLEGADMIEESDGPWVKFEDHEKALIPLAAEIRCLKASNKALDEEYEMRRFERDKASRELDELKKSLEVQDILELPALKARLSTIQADKRELVEMLERITHLYKLSREANGGDIFSSAMSLDKALALIAKHKEGHNA